MAERSSIDLESDPLAIIGIAPDRRAARPGVVGVDRSQASGAMVGAGRLSHHDQRFDFKPGGVWRFVMHGPDGRDYENRVTFDEIVPPELLRYHHGGGDDVEPVQFRTTVTFERSATRRASPCAACSRRPRSARASSRSTAPTRAWRRRWRGSANMPKG